MKKYPSIIFSVVAGVVFGLALTYTLNAFATSSLSSTGLVSDWGAVFNDATSINKDRVMITNTGRVLSSGGSFANGRPTCSTGWTIDGSGFKCTDPWITIRMPGSAGSGLVTYRPQNNYANWHAFCMGWGMTYYGNNVSGGLMTVVNFNETTQRYERMFNGDGVTSVSCQ